MPRARGVPAATSARWCSPMARRCFPPSLTDIRGTRRAHVKKLFMVSALVLAGVPLLAQWQAGRAGGAADPIGQVASQRRNIPTGPVPRLPDGRVDLNGVWTGGGP